MFLSHCRPFIPLLQKLFFTSDVNGLHETKDYVSCGGVILCFEVMVVTREDFLLKFAALGQARKLAWPNLRSFSKNTSLVTTLTSKTNHHYSTANKCLMLAVEARFFVLKWSQLLVRIFYYNSRHWDKLARPNLCSFSKNTSFVTTTHLQNKPSLLHK